MVRGIYCLIDAIFTIIHSRQNHQIMEDVREKGKSCFNNEYGKWSNKSKEINCTYFGR
jgi:hypothetical protein